MKIYPKHSVLTVKQIAEIVGATLEGPAELTVSGLCSLEDDLAGQLSLFTSKSGVSISQKLASLKIHALLVRQDVRLPERKAAPAILRVKDPVRALIDLIPHFIKREASLRGISEKAEIDPSAKIGSGVQIGAFCSVAAEVSIGENSSLYPHVTVYPGAKIGANVTIHSGAVIRENCVVEDGCTIQNGAVIGSDGFGYVLEGQTLIAVPQVGNVKLSRAVDVGANSCIDRATLGSTKIGPGAKLDNLVQVGHNTSIGAGSVLCGQAGVAGSCTIGNGVVLGGQAGIADHITIVDGSRFSAKAGVTGNIPEKGDYGGYPAVPIKTWRREMKALERLASKREKKLEDN